MVYKLGQLNEVAKRVVDLIDQESATIIAMEGELGSGKTALTKAIAKELGIIDTITSPTFVLNVEYGMLNLDRKLQHIDVWRMESFDELERIGLQKMIDEKSIIVIEWADRFKSQISNYKLQAKIVWVKLEYGEKEDERIVLISEV